MFSHLLAFKQILLFPTCYVFPLVYIPTCIPMCIPTCILTCYDQTPSHFSALNINNMSNENLLLLEQIKS